MKPALGPYKEGWPVGRLGRVCSSVRKRDRAPALYPFAGLRRLERVNDADQISFADRQRSLPFEATTRHASVVHGVPGVAMPEIVLHGAQVGAPVGKIVATRVAQRMRMDPLQAGTLALRRAPSTAPIFWGK
jgi:hypothetical protein